MILIGSKAYHHHDKSFREGKDTDYLVFEPRNSTKEVEYHYHPDFVTHRRTLYNWVVDHIATPSFLYTLKVSHSFWDVHWQKTISDIRYMKRHGCVLIPELYDVFYPIWEQVHGKKPVNLNVPNEEFFTPIVDRVIPHDELHEMFKTGDVPKYKLLKKDPSKALISREMFFAQPYEEQLNTVREEMCVLAAERYLIPALVPSPGQAVRLALKLLVTSASKGWFPLFIVDNWDKVLEARLPTALGKLWNQSNLKWPSKP
jgi:hypothetical protein